MSQVKRLLELHAAQHATALDIAVRAGALQRCEYHEDVVVEGSGDLQAACRLGNALITAGEVDVFDSRRQMTDMVKAVIDEHAASDCYMCDRLLRD